MFKFLTCSVEEITPLVFYIYINWGILQIIYLAVKCHKLCE